MASVHARGSQKNDGEGLLGTPTAFVSLWAAHQSTNYAVFSRTDLGVVGTAITWPFSFPIAGGFGYQVPSGKIFHITSIIIGTNGAANFPLLYGDNDVGMSTNTVPTNAKTLIGQQAQSLSPFNVDSVAGNPGVDNAVPYIVHIRVPALKYIYYYGGTMSTGSMYIEGYEASI